MKIDWDKIVTNALSTVITGIVVSALVILWKGATTVDEKVREATHDLNLQAEYMSNAVVVLQQEAFDLHKKDGEIIDALNGLDGRFDEMETIIREAFASRDKGPSDSPEIEDLFFMEEMPSAPETTGSKEEYLVEPNEMPNQNFIQQRLPEFPMPKMKR